MILFENLIFSRCRILKCELLLHIVSIITFTPKYCNPKKKQAIVDSSSAKQLRN